MSDYLLNLANRALGRATVMRPRTAPWFGETGLIGSAPAEPTTPSEVPAEQFGMPDASGRVDATEPESALAAHPEAGVRSLSIPAAKEPEAAEQRRAGETEEARIVKGKREEQPEANWRPVKAVSKAQPVDSLWRVSDSNAISGPAVAPAFSSEPYPKGTGNSQMQPATESTRRTDQSPAPTQTSRRPLSQNETAPPETTQRGSNPALRVTASAQPPVKGIRPDLQALQPTRVTSRGVSVEATRTSAGNSAPPFPRSRQRDPTPTIQVTIGRVEVRANSSAPAPRQTPFAPASTSLDDYLKRRARGGAVE